MGDADTNQREAYDYPPSLTPLLERFRSDQTPVLRTGAGWWPLLVRLNERLAVIDPDYEVRHVEEEYADLFFDARPSASCSSPERFREAVDEGEREAGRTCEVCGRYGSMMRQGDWLITLCDDDARARGARPIRRHENLNAIEPRPTDREIAFALSAGVPVFDFTAAGKQARREWAETSQRLDEEEVAAWPTARDVAGSLLISASEVDRLHRENKIGAKKDRQGRWRYAPWQLSTNAGLLPYLADILAAAGDLDVLDLHPFMTEQDENLEDLSPVSWLESGRDPQRVIDLLEKMQWV